MNGPVAKRQAATPGQAATPALRLAGVPQPSQRYLYGEDLEDYAAELAGRAELWRHLVEHDVGRRHYAELLSDDYVTAWLICWMRDHDTGYHDHDISWGAVAVIAGAVREERLPANGGRRDAVFSAGQSFHFSPVDIHRVTHAGEAPAVTLHVYSPPLLSMGAYEQDRDGTLRRRLVSAEHELRAASVEGPRHQRLMATSPAVVQRRERCGQTRLRPAENH